MLLALGVSIGIVVGLCIGLHCLIIKGLPIIGKILCVAEMKRALTNALDAVAKRMKRTGKKAVDLELEKGMDSSSVKTNSTLPSYHMSEAGPPSYRISLKRAESIYVASQLGYKLLSASQSGYELPPTNQGGYKMPLASQSG